MHSQYRAFTLVELTIVIAILAIATAIGIPTYTDYSIRTRVAESLEAASDARTAVTEELRDDGGLANRTTREWPTGGAEYIDSITIDAAGNIRVATRGTGTRFDPVVELQPTLAFDRQVAWHCRRVDGLDKRLPNECRNE